MALHSTVFTAVVTVLAASMAGPAAAQDVEGRIDDWAGGPADLMNWEMGGPPTVIGSVAADGAIQLDLPETTDADQPLSRVFSCGDDTVTTTDAEARYTITSSALMVGSIERQKIMGSLIAATNREAAAARAGVSTVAAGRYYQWLYTPGDVTIEGVCLSDVFPDGKTRVEVTTNYQMALAPGWNILEIDIAQIEHSDEGFDVARDRTFRTVPALPPEVKWFYWPEQE